MYYVHVDNPSSLREYNRLITQVPSIVLFYMPGCFHCEAMKPEWEAFEHHARQRYRSQPCMVARVRSDYMSEVNGDRNILGYPTIFYMMDGKQKSEHSGERDLKNLIAFASKHIKSPPKRETRVKSVSKSRSKSRSRSKSKRSRRHTRKRSVASRKSSKRSASERRKRVHTRKATPQKPTAIRSRFTL